MQNSHLEAAPWHKTLRNVLDFLPLGTLWYGHALVPAAAQTLLVSELSSCSQRSPDATLSQRWRLDSHNPVFFQLKL